MTASEVAGLALAVIAYGIAKRLSQVVLFVLNHNRRSE